jgi:hypothetical protein
MIMDGSQIKSVSAEGLSYIDQAGEEIFIAFSDCYENYVKRRLTPEIWQRYQELNRKYADDWDSYVAWVRERHEVGIRQVLTPPWADGPYIEFHTEPPTRFQFRTEEEYSQVLLVIHEAGWQTFDQS